MHSKDVSIFSGKVPQNRERPIRLPIAFYWCPLTTNFSANFLLFKNIIFKKILYKKILFKTITVFSKKNRNRLGFSLYYLSRFKPVSGLTQIVNRMSQAISDEMRKNAVKLVNGNQKSGMGSGITMWKKAQMYIPLKKYVIVCN